MPISFRFLFLMHSKAKFVATHAWRVLPNGGLLPNEVWWRRHRVILALLGANAAAITGLGIANGYGIAHSVAESSLIALVAPRRK